MATYYVTQAAAGGGAGTSGDPFTLAEAADNVAAGDKVWVQADADYTAQDGATGAVLNISTGGSTTVGYITWEGYTTTIGDGGVATLDASVNTLANAILASGASGAYNAFVNLRLTGGTGNGFAGGTALDQWYFRNCEIDNNGTTSGPGLQGDDNLVLVDCTIHDNSSGAIDCDNNLRLFGCGIYNNSGANVVSAQGTAEVIGCLFYNNGNNINVRVSAGGFTIVNNTFDGDSAGTDACIEVSGSASVPSMILNNIIMDFTNGITFGNPYANEATVDNNMFVNVTNDYDADYAGGPNDISTSTDPFNDSANRDYSLPTGSAARDAGIDAS